MPDAVARPRRWLILLPLLLGVAALVVLVNNRSLPEQTPAVETARAVRVLAAPLATVIPRVSGHGTVQPGRTWEAVAEVNGRIIDLHPHLDNGELLPADSVLLRIDPSDYELALARAEADLQASDAQLAELAIKADNTRAALAIEEDALRLAEQELTRKRTLNQQGTVTRSDLDREERQVLSQRQSVQNLRNTLNLIPAERRLLDAQRARSQTLRDSARRDLERTVIRLPFAGRVSSVNVERTQFVRQGEVLTVIDGIDRAEIVAYIPLNRMRDLLAGADYKLADFIAQPDPAQLRRALGLSATVYLRGQGLDLSYPAHFARLGETIDPRTRMVGVIVAVDEPYQLAQPGVRPPLIKGLFVEVELRGRPRPDSLLLPRSALHDGNTVYIANADNRLERRTVTVGLAQDEFVVISGGLAAGERVVLSDLSPASEQMLLAPQPDPVLQARLLAEAQGEATP